MARYAEHDRRGSRDGRGRRPRRRGGAEALRRAATGSCSSTAPASKARLEQLAATLPGACVVAGDITDERRVERGDAAHRARARRGRRRSPRSSPARGAGARRSTKRRATRPGAPMMSANVETVHRSLVRLLPAMVARKRGSVVVVGSRAAEQPWTSAGAAAYAAAKSAVVALAPDGRGRGARARGARQRDPAEHDGHPRQSRRHAQGRSRQVGVARFGGRGRRVSAERRGARHQRRGAAGVRALVKLRACPRASTCATRPS